MLKSVGLNELEKSKVEIEVKNNDIRNGLIAWAILIIIFISVFKGN